MDDTASLPVLVSGSVMQHHEVEVCCALSGSTLCTISSSVGRLVGYIRLAVSAELKISPIQEDYVRALRLVQKIPDLLEELSGEFKRDREIVKAAVQRSGHALQFADPELRSDREIILMAIRTWTDAFMCAPATLQSEIGFVKEAVSINCRAFRFAGVLQHDPQFVTEVFFDLQRKALDQSHLDLLPRAATAGESFTRREHSRELCAAIPGHLWEDRAVVLAAVSYDGFLLQHAAGPLREDIDVVQAAVACDGLSLEFASSTLRGSFKIARAAVTNNGMALKFTSKACSDDFEIVHRAVARDGVALQFASNKLQDELEVVRAAVAENGEALQFVSEHLRANRDIVLAAIRNNMEGRAGEESVLRYASEALRADFEVAWAAVECNGLALEYVSDCLKQRRDLILCALRQDNYAIEFVPYHLRLDREIAMAAVTKSSDYTSINFYVTSCLPPCMRCDKALMMQAIQNDSREFQHAGEELKKDKEVVWTALEDGDYDMLEHASTEIRSNSEFMLSLLRRHGCYEMLRYASPALLEDITFMNRALASIDCCRRDAYNLAPRALRDRWSLKQIMLHHRIPVTAHERVAKRARKFLRRG